MADATTEVDGAPKTERLTLDQLQGGWSTRSFPHAIADNQLSVLDNFMHLRDNVWTVRPGNTFFGGGSGATGSGAASLSGARFYFGNPVLGQLVVHSGSQLWKGADVGGAFTSVGTGLSASQPSTYTQMYDPDLSTGAAVGLFQCDGSRVPHIYDGTHYVAVQTGGVFLPNGVVSGVPITPLYVTDWNYNLVYANEPTDPTALWIADSLRPERFTGTSLTDSAGSTYIPYYPGGRNSKLGVITGVINFGNVLIIFFTSGIITATNTGSYGSFQYVFNRLSSTVGCPAPQSIVAMDSAVFFFGGDRFYATDGNYLAPVPDEIPTLYSDDNVSAMPPEIANPMSVSAGRNSLQYMAGYTSTQSPGGNDRVVVFDTGANNGWAFSPTGLSDTAEGQSAGGAWTRFPSGFPMAWGLQCRGPGDTKTSPFFWGAATGDIVAQFDAIGAPNTDFGTAISFEIRTKSFFLDKPVNPKLVDGLYPIMVFTVAAAGQTVNVQPYMFFDPGIPFLFTPQTYTIPIVGTTYGAKVYGSFDYTAPQTYNQQTIKALPAGGPITASRGNSFAAGISGSTITSFNIIGFVVEVIVDDPEF